MVGDSIVTRVLLKRSLSSVPLVIAASFLMFMLLFVGPNPLQQLQDTNNLGTKELAHLTQLYGWDQPWYQQYGRWMSNTVHGNLGESIRTHESAAAMIKERLPTTFTLAILSMLLSLTVALPLGAVLANKRGSKRDWLSTGVTFALMALPGFLMAVLLQSGAVWLHDLTGKIIFDTGGGPQNGSLLEAFRHMTLPVLTLSMMQVAGWVRYQRSEMLGVLNSEYILVARAKGIGERTVLLRHALRNTLVPVITLASMDLAHLIGGSVITETVFGLPGLGRLLIDSVQAHDNVVALDIVMLLALAMVVAATVADAINGALDPRSRDA